LLQQPSDRRDPPEGVSMGTRNRWAMLVCIVGLHATALAAPFTNGSFEGGT